MENKNKPENPFVNPVIDTCQHTGHVFQKENGITLRDHFAWQAIPSIARNYAQPGYVDAHNISKDCYAIADAMLKERGKSDE